MSFSTYLASTSTSRFTGRPGATAPSVVRASVSGISETSRARSSTAETVSETPSTVADRLDLADAVDVALDDLAAEAPVGPQRELEVHPVAFAERAERAAAQGLGHDVGGEPVPLHLASGQADAVDGYRVPVGQLGRERRGDEEAHPPPVVALDGRYFADRLHEAREHRLTTPAAAR